MKDLGMDIGGMMQGLAKIAYVKPPAVDWDMSIQRALEWAFCEEYVRLDQCWPDQEGVVNEYERGSVDSVWVLQQQHKLGCRIDGGAGSSDPHVDALIIASEIGMMLYEPSFGKEMVLKVVDCARARQSPYWGREEKRGVIPHRWDLTDKGEWIASTRKLPQSSYRDRKGFLKHYAPTICPISFTGSAAVIGKYRREYLEWYGALLHLHARLSLRGLQRVRLNGILPELSPWKSS